MCLSGSWLGTAANAIASAGTDALPRAQHLDTGAALGVPSFQIPVNAAPDPGIDIHGRGGVGTAEPLAVR
jgi:hypothetical protein